MAVSIHNYYEIAENDYLWMQATMKHHKEGDVIYNSSCAHAQNTVEKFLKHIRSLLPFLDDDDSAERASLLRSHNVKRLCSYLRKSSVNLNYESFEYIDGYYFETRCPGDESYFVEEYDLQRCWRALQNCKREVDAWLKEA